jgi:hypothetical protein
MSDWRATRCRWSACTIFEAAAETCGTRAMPGLGQLHRDHRWKVIDLAMRYSKEPAMG